MGPVILEARFSLVRVIDSELLNNNLGGNEDKVKQLWVLFGQKNIQLYQMCF